MPVQPSSAGEKRTTRFQGRFGEEMTVSQPPAMDSTERPQAGASPLSRTHKPMSTGPIAGRTPSPSTGRTATPSLRFQENLSEAQGVSAAILSGAGRTAPSGREGAGSEGAGSVAASVRNDAKTTEIAPMALSKVCGPVAYTFRTLVLRAHLTSWGACLPHRSEVVRITPPSAPSTRMTTASSGGRNNQTRPDP